MKTMSTLTHPPIEQTHSEQATSILSRFFRWSKDQQPNQFLWLGVALLGHGCIITPLTIFFVYLAGMNFILFAVALSAMTAALIVNLSAMPTRITIPVLLASVVTDILVIAAAFGMALSS